MRSPRKGNALIHIYYLRGQPKVCYFDLLVLDEDIGRLDISMHEAFWRKVLARWYNLLGKLVDLVFIAVEKVLMDVLLEVALAVFEEEVQIVASLLDI